MGLKSALQSTFLYTIYLFFVKYARKTAKFFRKKTKSFIKRIRKFIRGKYNRLYTEYVIAHLYPSIYKKYSKLPVDEKKVVFVEIRLPKLTNSLQLLYDNLYANTDFDLHCHFLRNTFVTRKEYRERCKAMIRDMATAKYVFFDEATNITGRFVTRPETVALK